MNNRDEKTEPSDQPNVTDSAISTAINAAYRRIINVSNRSEPRHSFDEVLAMAETANADPNNDFTFDDDDDSNGVEWGNISSIEDLTTAATRILGDNSRAREIFLSTVGADSTSNSTSNSTPASNSTSNSKSTVKKIKCSICLEFVNTQEGQPTFTPCFHGYHDKCIRQWIQVNKSNLVIPCPVCKNDIADLAGYRDPYSLYHPDQPLPDIVSGVVDARYMNEENARVRIARLFRSGHTGRSDNFELEADTAARVMEFLGSRTRENDITLPSEDIGNWDDYLVSLVDSELMPAEIARDIRTMAYVDMSMVLVPFGETVRIEHRTPGVYYLTVDNSMRSDPPISPVANNQTVSITSPTSITTRDLLRRSRKRIAADNNRRRITYAKYRRVTMADRLHPRFYTHACMRYRRIITDINSASHGMIRVAYELNRSDFDNSPGIPLNELFNSSHSSLIFSQMLMV